VNARGRFLFSRFEEENVMKPPLEDFLSQALKDFEAHLRGPADPKQQRREPTIGHRLRGATQFAAFLLGKPAQKNERIKGTI
jgi:hypothetical protein